jgi:hypothetical protein
MSFYDRVKSVTSGIFLSKERNTVNASRSRFKPSPSSRGNQNPFFIDRGATGIVFRNRTDPKKVFKVFTRKVNVNNEYNKADRVFKYTKNNRQKVQIVKGFKFGNLSENVKKVMRAQSNEFNLNEFNLNEYEKKKNALNKKILSVIRMENLGIDLHTCIHIEEKFNQLAKMPDIVPMILTQFYKLIHQVDQLRNHKLCHCDIRMENIMIDVDTCTLTLIDFDQLGTFDQTIANLQGIASYSFHTKQEFSTAWPIEWVVICNAFSEEPLSHDALIELYMTDEILKIYEISYGIETSKAKESLIKFLRETLIAITDWVVGVIQIIRTHRASSNNATPLIELMSRFDIFGLGFVFSYFLYYLQRNIAFKTRRDVLDTHRVSLNRALNVARSMCNFNILQRPTPTEALSTMTAILGDARIPVSGGRQRQTRRR